jgi:hypothetical protein
LPVRAALDNKLWLKKGSHGGGPEIPQFGGCGGHDGGMAVSSRCSRLFLVPIGCMELALIWALAVLGFLYVLWTA